MPLLEYAIGQAVRLQAAVRDADGEPVDPATITIRVASPAAVETDYTLAGGQVIRDSTGLYYTDVIPNSAGTWSYAARTTVPTTTTMNKTFLVTTSVFD